MAEPLVSIVIANYNYAHFLGDAIESGLQQTYENTEVIVVDDGSTDSSREVIAKYGNRVRPVLMAKNRGQSSSFNLGFAHSRGQIICFLDSDDVFAPEKVARIVDAHSALSDGWCFHQLQWVDTQMRPVAGSPPAPLRTGPYDFRRDSLRGKHKVSAPATSGLTFSRSLLERLLPIPENVLSSDNYLKFCSLAFAPGFYISDSLGLQRIHGANIYTAVDNPLMKANVQLSVAKGLKTRFPQLRVGHRIFAAALAAKWKAGAGFREWSADLRSYLTGLPLSQKADVLMRTTAYRAIRA